MACSDFTFVVKVISFSFDFKSCAVNRKSIKFSFTFYIVVILVMGVIRRRVICKQPGSKNISIYFQSLPKCNCIITFWHYDSLKLQKLGSFDNQTIQSTYSNST